MGCVLYTVHVCALNMFGFGLDGKILESKKNFLHKYLKVKNVTGQAGTELCQAQHNLGKLPVAWNFALAGASQQ